jgi:protein-tyrosine phosphatase
MAEGVFEKLVKDSALESYFHIDSAGTSNYHIGNLPDHRMRETASQYAIDLTHRARQFSRKDFHDFDYIVAMDAVNFKDITQLQDHTRKSRAKVILMRDFDPEKTSIGVPDPYYGGKEGFEDVYKILHRSSGRFLNYLVKEHQLKQLL